MIITSRILLLLTTLAKLHDRSQSWSLRTVSPHTITRLRFISSRNAPPLQMTPQGDDERMKTVRRLQDTFYSSPATENSTTSYPSAIPRLDGTINSLPLWRVPWTELPGRSNALIVHEARYTHMFEEIIRGSQRRRRRRDIYFGNLRLPGGSSSIGRAGYELYDWRKEAAMTTSGGGEGGGVDDALRCRSEDTATEHSSCRSAVVGTLMRVVDFRRMGDGKMLILVQALDRFVVTNPIRELPYSLADVRLLPDGEEIEYHMDEDDDDCIAGDGNEWYAAIDSTEADRLRSIALVNALKWRAFEYDDTVRLPVRDDGEDDLGPADVVGAAFQGVIPHVPFSSTIAPSELAHSEILPRDDEDSDRAETGTKPVLEKQLVNSGILLGPTEPDPSRRRSFYSAKEMEKELWIFVNEWVRIHDAVSTFPRELLALLPRNIDWPDDFILEDLAVAMAATADLEGSRPFVRVTEDYPAHRRRKRLSYIISALTDHTPFGRGMPPILLEIYSTRDRLEAVIDIFEFINTEAMGKFN